MPLDPADSLESLQERLEKVADRVDHVLEEGGMAKSISQSVVGTVTPGARRRRSGTGAEAR